MNLYVLVAGEIFILIFSYLLFRDILSPSFDISFVFLTATLIILPYQKKWNIEYSLKTTILLLTGMSMFFLVELAVFGLSPKRKKIPQSDFSKEKIINVPKYYQMLSVGILIVTILLLWKEVVRIGSAWNYYGLISNLMKNYRNRTVYGYDSVDFITSQMMKVSTAIGYVNAFVIVNNYILGGKKQLRENIGSIVAAFLLFALQLENSTRGSIINFAIYIVVIYYVKTRWVKGWNPKTTHKIVKVIVASVMAIAIVFFGSRSLIGRDVTESVFANAARYYGGSIQLFNLYVQSPIEGSKYWGLETFTGIYQSLYKMGLVDYRPTIAMEFRNLGSYTGNVYTFFRRPLQDFGLIGMIFFTVIIAFIFCASYYNLIREKKESNLRLIYYAYFYHWIMQSVIECYSFNLSIMSFVSLILIALIYYLFTTVRIIFRRR